MAVEPQITQDLVTSPIFRFRGQRSRWRYPHPRLEPEVCVKVSNINFSEFGTTDRRRGYEKYSTSQLTSSEPVVGLHQQKFLTPDATYEIINTPDKIYADAAGASRKNITGSISLTGGGNDFVRSVFILDTVVQTNGIDAPWKWLGDYATPTNAAALTSASTLERCKDLVVNENLLVALYTRESSTWYPTRIRWSDIDTNTFQPDISNWPTDNRYEIDEGTEEIVGGIDNFGRVLIFKRNGVYPGYFQFTQGYITFHQEEPKLGFRPVARHSIVKRPDFVWCVADDGCYVVDSSLKVQKVTDDIQNEWEGLNKSRLKYAGSTVRVKDHQVRTLLSSADNSAGHDLILIWDWETGDIGFDRLSDVMNYMVNRYDTNNNELDWMGGALSGYLYDGNGSSITTADAANYSWEIITAANDLEAPNRVKVIKNVTVWYKATGGSPTATLEVVRDQGVRSTRTKTLTLGGGTIYNAGNVYNSGLIWPGGSNRKARFFVNRSAENLSLRLYGDGDANLHGYSVEYLPAEG